MDPGPESGYHSSNKIDLKGVRFTFSISIVMILQV